MGGNKRDAAALCSAGLWSQIKSGWQFHEWSVYQPDAASLKVKRKSEVEGGVLGNHNRWHKARNIIVPDCEYCQGMPPEDDIEPSPPDGVPDQVPESGLSVDPIPPVPEPHPLVKKVGGGRSPKYSEGDANDAPPIQHCGERHPSAKDCRACGTAREQAKSDAAAALKAKASADRKQAAQTRAQSRADDDATEPATPEQIAQAKAAIRAGAK